MPFLANAPKATVTTLLVSQTNFADHRTPPGHPERADRIIAVEEALATEEFERLVRREAPYGDITLAELVHDERYMARLRMARPAEGIGQLDPDTYISDQSLSAAATGLGGAMAGLDAVVMGEVDNAFCAIVAREAQRKYGAERVAIIDFDVHHGNGTQDIFYDDPTVFYASSHQMPLFPGTGHPSEHGVGNIVNAALKAHTDGSEMRAAYNEIILPALDNFSPDLILISAGFDAHERDPLAQLEWVDQDFAWVTGKLMDVAERRCGNRIVSLLEGGYDLKGLAGGVRQHVAMLMDGATSSLNF